MVYVTHNRYYGRTLYEVFFVVRFFVRGLELFLFGLLELEFEFHSEFVSNKLHCGEIHNAVNVGHNAEYHQLLDYILCRFTYFFAQYFNGKIFGSYYRLFDFGRHKNLLLFLLAVFELASAHALFVEIFLYKAFAYERALVHALFIVAGLAVVFLFVVERLARTVRLRRRSHIRTRQQRAFCSRCGTRTARRTGSAHSRTGIRAGANYALRRARRNRFHNAAYITRRSIELTGAYCGLGRLRRSGGRLLFGLFLLNFLRRLLFNRRLGVFGRQRQRLLFARSGFSFARKLLFLFTFDCPFALSEPVEQRFRFATGIF